ncbi:uncharacterized protein BXZ73DRAFT_43460 [Epithele typhae]|uniref:uncharacterized protein n=1 Tax=Epithele typhae TaxID=378194 RepID=UPI002007F2B7|nr:uncharacterized protein BXZ73DRAFT_43460 [Epithele typhae]KAH9939669.1 hypothetical protein BXZ73DRAFT_43460 [Epithele typhae]
MSQSTLLPGYNHVDAFGPDGDYEDVDGEVEEEVEYVTLDLGSIEPTLVPSSSAYRLIGLDSPTPFLQLSGTMLKGQHVSLLGTELLFAESAEDGADRSKRALAHVAITEKRIRFREVELKPKSSSDAPAAGPPTTEAKSSNTAKKVQSQMKRVMAGSAGPSRRGRGGRKRGRGLTRAQAKARQEVDEVDEPNAEPDAVRDVGDSASVAMDTSEG